MAVFPVGHDGGADSGSHVIVLACGWVGRGGSDGGVGWERFVQYSDDRERNGKTDSVV